MPDTVLQVDYFYVQVADKPGAAFQILTQLKQAGVSLLACCGFPLQGGKAQLDLVPEHPDGFVKAAKKLELKLSGRKKALLIQGEDRVGAVADTFGKLAGQKISVVASQAVCAGSRRWAMILWVKPADYERASRALRDQGRPIV